MANIGDIKEHMEVIGADGVHVGTVDKLEGDRIKLTKRDSGQGSHEGHHHFLSVGLVAGVEHNKVRLSATGANAFMFQEEDVGSERLVTSHTTVQPTTPYRAGRVQSPRERMRPHWAKLGFGTATVGTLIGLAALARNKFRAHNDFEIELPTDESVRLISSAKVEGTPVVGRNGEHLGKIDSFMVDKFSGHVAYAVMSFGGTFGFGEALFPLPWSYLSYDDAKSGYLLGITKEQLADAPRFKAGHAPDYNPTYRQNLAQFYRR